MIYYRLDAYWTFYKITYWKSPKVFNDPSMESLHLTYLKNNQKTSYSQFNQHLYTKLRAAAFPDGKYYLLMIVYKLTINYLYVIHYKRTINSITDTLFKELCITLIFSLLYTDMLF